MLASTQSIVPNFDNDDHRNALEAIAMARYMMYSMAASLKIDVMYASKGMRVEMSPNNPRII